MKGQEEVSDNSVNAGCVNVTDVDKSGFQTAADMTEMNDGKKTGGLEEMNDGAQVGGSGETHY